MDNGLDSSNHTLLECTGILLHHLYHLLVVSKQGTTKLRLVDGVLSGNSPDGRVIKEHVQSGLGSVDLLVHGDQMGELQTTIDLGQKEPIWISRLGQSTPSLEKSGGNWLEVVLQP